MLNRCEMWSDFQESPMKESSLRLEDCLRQGLGFTMLNSGLIRSMGSGNIIVEFFSAAMLLRV
jgi:hypothetical protein